VGKSFDEKKLQVFRATYRTVTDIFVIP